MGRGIHALGELMADHGAVLVPIAYADPLVGLRSAGGVSYLMQANDSVTSAAYSWLSNSPDFAGAGYPGPNSPTNVVVSVRHI